MSEFIVTNAKHVVFMEYTHSQISYAMNPAEALQLAYDLQKAANEVIKLRDLDNEY